MDKSAYTRIYTSIYRGKVEINEDPKKLGRCKIRVPAVHGELTYSKDLLPWARPLVLTPVGTKKGSVNIPAVGDIVWVFFEEANRDFPVYLGGTYATTDEIDIDLDVIDFYIEEDVKFSYSRKDKTFTTRVGDTELIVSANGVTIQGNLTVTGTISSSS